MALDPGPSLPASPVCEHLGLPLDPDTHFAFAAPTNRCHFGSFPAQVAEEHQSAFCLGPNHDQCPVHLGALKPSPRRIIGSRLPARRGVPDLVQDSVWAKLRPALTGAVVILVAGSALAMMFASPHPAVPITSLESTPTARAATTVPTATEAVIQTPGRTPTATSTATVAPSATPSPAPSDLPVGPYSLLLYRVQPQDTLAIIAYDQQTTTAALRTVNGLASEDILQIGQELIVPVGITSADGLPRMEVYRVEAPETVAAVADRTGAAADEIRWANALEQEVVPTGRLLFIPRAPLPTATAEGGAEP